MKQKRRWVIKNCFNSSAIFNRIWTLNYGFAQKVYYENVSCILKCMFEA